MEELTAHLAAWQADGPKVERPLVAIFAGSHGVAERGVSAYPAAVNHAMVATFARDGAAINQICKAGDIGLKVFELALDRPTADFTLLPAMTEKACAATIAYGMEAVAGGVDVLCVGEMGIGNTTSAAAIYHLLYGGAAADWVGRGTGVDDAAYARKIAAVAAARATHAMAEGDPLAVLASVGGREIAAIAGAILAARMERVVVILDGYVATAAAAILHALAPGTIAHCLAGHRSPEGAHGAVLARLGLAPILDLGMRLGEGTGAALALGIVRAAAACHAGMATFETAGVPEA